jgi:tRNA(fMet)-specific endonuclease VapC
MLQFLFDTDHLTLYEHGHAKLAQRLSSCSPGEVGVSVVTAEEALRGRLAAVAKARDPGARIRRYQRLSGTIQVFHGLPLVPYDQISEDAFQRFAPLRLRIGTRDLRIAPSAIAHGLILITRNRSDYSRVPGISLDDWS